LFARHGDRAIIGINGSQAPVRQRFSIAHELGHFVLHHEAEHLVELDAQLAGESHAPGFDGRKEQAANNFAAELLMPGDWVRADARSYSLSRLAKRYDVSEAAMAFRLTNLRVAPVS